jgi:hypothetical protein
MDQKNAGSPQEVRAPVRRITAATRRPPKIAAGPALAELRHAAALAIPPRSIEQKCLNEKETI